VTSDGDSQLLLYIKAKGQPKLINDPNAGFEYCTYDSHGNFFAGNNSRYYSHSTWHYEAFISELPHGASAFENFKLNENVTGSDGVLGIQSHQGYLAIGDGIDSNIYQVRISNAVAKVGRKTILTEAKATRQFSFYHDKLISPDPLSALAGVWNYPAGGKPVHQIDDLYGEPLGSAISVP
jgi:hypothetical protein